MTDPPWFVFAGGGTGGHLFPALSVVDALRLRGEPIDVSFFCTQRQIDRDILGAAGVTAVPQPVMPFATKPWAWPKFLLRWQQSVKACLRAFRYRRPAAVVGAGGYASGPPVHAAARLGIPAFLLNPDAVPGRANQHMARRGRISGVFAQWDVTRRYFPPSVAVTVSGCPVRPAFRAVTGRPVSGLRESFGLQPDRPVLLVTGASQGARTINEAIMSVAGQVAAADWQILHLSGPADLARVEACYQHVAGQGISPSHKLCYRVLAFTDRMPEAMAASELIISRAGASTLSEIQAVGRPSVLFPYPYHRDQHQRHNAAVLAAAGAAVLLDDRREAAANAAQLAPVLSELLADAERRAAMSRAARSLDRPDAARSIAHCLYEAGRLKESLIIAR